MAVALRAERRVERRPQIDSELADHAAACCCPSCPASFNLHGDQFGPMAIRDQAGAPVEPACVGWGLERGLAAIVARWGADPAL